MRLGGTALDVAYAPISIHAPMKGATHVRTAPGCRSAGTISIHAPMKGATWMFVVMFRVQTMISIHAPMKGATTGGHPLWLGFGYFNPRTHEGCDSLQINSVIACFSIIYIAN